LLQSVLDSVDLAFGKVDSNGTLVIGRQRGERSSI
jgi:hypothetical protein